MSSEHSQACVRTLNITEELNCQRGKQQGGSGSLNFQRQPQALTWTWKEVKSLFPSQVVLSGSRSGVCGARRLFKINTCGKERKEARVGGGGGLSCYACQPSGCSGQGLPIESLMLDRNSWVFTLFQCAAAGRGPSQGKAWPCARQLSAAEVLPEGADSWKLSAGHTPCNWAVRPSLKEDPSSTFLSIIDPEVKLVLSASWRFPGFSEPPGLPDSVCPLQHLMSSKNYKEAGGLSLCGLFLLLSFFRHLSFLLLYFRHNIHLKLLSNTNSLF